MNVVLEGPDGGGKSTLAQIISDACGVRVQQGSGPPKEKGEVERRALEYLAMDRVIFDRHPCISQPVYAMIRGEVISHQLNLRVLELHSQNHLFIYCRSANLDRHVVKDGENPAHVAALEAKFETVLAHYDLWAVRHAHMIYRIGDDYTRVVMAAQAHLGAFVVGSNR